MALTNYDTAVAVDKMAGMFTQRICQPYICQPNELKREIDKNWGGGKQKSWAAMAHPGPPLESPLRVTPWAGCKSLISGAYT